MDWLNSVYYHYDLYNTSSYQAIKNWRIQGEGLIYFRKDQTIEVNKLVVYYQAFCFLFLRTCNL